VQIYEIAFLPQNNSLIICQKGEGSSDGIHITLLNTLPKTANKCVIQSVGAMALPCPSVK
jgi:hypothetical protein